MDADIRRITAYCRGLRKLTIGYLPNELHMLDGVIADLSHGPERTWEVIPDAEGNPEVWVVPVCAIPIMPEEV